MNRHDDLKSIFSKKFENMHGYTFMVGVLPYNPHVWKEADGSYGGYEIELLKVIADHRNFAIQIKIPPDGSWGAEDENGIWSGLIGQALYGATNLSMSYICISEEREMVIDYSVPFLSLIHI